RERHVADDPALQLHALLAQAERQARPEAVADGGAEDAYRVGARVLTEGRGLVADDRIEVLLGEAHHELVSVGLGHPALDLVHALPPRFAPSRTRRGRSLTSCRSIRDRGPRSLPRAASPQRGRCGRPSGSTPRPAGPRAP